MSSQQYSKRDLPPQARRVYEIVRLHYTSLKDKQEYKDYRSFHSTNNPLATICYGLDYNINTKYHLALQGRREEKVERPLPEGAGTCLFCVSR